MEVTVDPLESVIGARVTGISLADLPSTEEIDVIETALEAHGVLVFPNQAITPAQQVAFSAAFAPLEMTELEKARLPCQPEIFVVGNVGKGLVSFAPAEDGGELEWHTDHIHQEVPARASLLYALEVPEEGGDTLFACMYTAYAALSERLEELEPVFGVPPNRIFYLSIAPSLIEVSLRNLKTAGLIS